jgi:hypothetical protein
MLGLLPLPFAVDQDKTEVGDDAVHDANENQHTVRKSIRYVSMKQ